jgi:ABC-2 type transport system permease protein
VYRIAAGTTAISATMAEAGEGLTVGPVTSSETNQALAAAFACGFTLEADTIETVERPLSERPTVSTRTVILVSVGSAQAMFFALFTAQFGILSLYDERRNWTLQRLLVSPTPAGSILSGKLIGVFISVLFQLALLFISLTLVGSVLEGELVLIWGGNPFATIVVLLAISFAVAGFGMLLAGIVRSPEQGQIFASILNISLAAMGGAFGFNFPEPIARLSLIYWGRDALQQLAIGNTDVLQNVVVLLITGVIMFVVGLILFRKRFETL